MPLSLGTSHWHVPGDAGRPLAGHRYGDVYGLLFSRHAGTSVQMSAHDLFHWLHSVSLAGQAVILSRRSVDGLLGCFESAVMHTFYGGCTSFLQT